MCPGSPPNPQRSTSFCSLQRTTTSLRWRGFSPCTRASTKAPSARTGQETARGSYACRRGLWEPQGHGGLRVRQTQGLPEGGTLRLFSHQTTLKHETFQPFHRGLGGRSLVAFYSLLAEVKGSPGRSCSRDP